MIVVVRVVSLISKMNRHLLITVVELFYQFANSTRNIPSVHRTKIGLRVLLSKSQIAKYCSNDTRKIRQTPEPLLLSLIDY